MRCVIRHRTSYRYGRPVFLEPHLLRLTPRGDAAQRLLAHDLAIRPKPAGASPCTDLNGNTVLALWFCDLTDRLDIDLTCEVATLRDNPFDFLVDRERTRLPLVLAPEAAALAGPCLVGPAGQQAAARALAERLLADGAATAGDFLWALVTWMGRELTPTVRREPGILAPDAVLARGGGACRDLAVCAMAACRAVRIPTRFVSGYQEGDPDRDERDLHAWFEAWLPGGGWRGYDPGHGLAVADRHVVLAAAPRPEEAAPVTGCFRGDAVSVSLRHEVRFDLS